MGSRSALADEDDTVLLAQVAEGDAAALEELYGRHAAWLVAKRVVLEGARRWN